MDPESARADFQRCWGSYLEDLRLRFPEAGVRATAMDRAPYFTEYIRQMLVKQYGERRVYAGGLVIETTLDLKQQEMAQRELSDAIRRQNIISLRHNSEP